MSGVIPDGGEIMAADGDLAKLGTRTSLMALNLLMAMVPSGSGGFADAATEARLLARRMEAATADFAAVMATGATKSGPDQA